MTNNKLKSLFQDDPNWKFREHVSPNGERTNTYYYKNRKCHRFTLNSKLTNQLAGYSLIEKDLRNIKSWLSEILPYLKTHKISRPQISPNREQFNLVKGLFVSAVTFYGKCFTQCDGRKTKLHKTDIKDDKLKEQHDEIMNFRHNFTAHSGEEKFEHAVISLVLDTKKSRNTLPQIVREVTQPDTIGVSDIDDFFELLEYLQNFVLEKMNKIQHKIYEEEVLAKGPEYWYKKIKKI
jgi:hypothetical protein